MLKKILTKLLVPRGAEFTAGELAEKFGLELRGDGGARISSVAPIADAGPGQLAFYSTEKNSDAFRILPIDVLKKTRATIIVLQSENAKHAPKRATLLITPSPRNAIVKILNAVYAPKIKPGISPRANVMRGAKIDPTAIIEPGAYIGATAIIGANTRVMPGAYIDNATVGADCVIGPNSSVGRDSFGYTRQDGKNIFLPHAGRAVLGNRVDVGACSCIDRGMLIDTTVGDGTKIGNCCQVTHNCVIGRECFITGHVAMAGGIKIGDRVMIGGQVGITNNVKIGDDVEIAAGSMIIGDIPAGQKYMGYPAMPAMEFLRSVAWVKRQVRRKKDEG
jgi:UDP-3-O-[3-hydroxymyristoyl] glucosamine N-acyltransferase